MSSKDSSEYKIYSGSDRNRDNLTTNQHGDIDHEIDSKMGGGANLQQQQVQQLQSRRIRHAQDARNARKENIEKLKQQQRRPVWTSTKQSMSYVTIRGIESDTSWLLHEWPLQILKELLSNAWDWLEDCYPDGDEKIRKIAVYLKVESILDDGIKKTVIRIRVRNSNVDDLPVFDNLDKIFDYLIFHSTKRHQHRLVSGALGDFLKRGLGMEYAAWTEDHDKERVYSAQSSDKQWLEPIIFRHNGVEDKVFIHVEWDEQKYWANHSERIDYDASDFTEVQITLPIDLILKRSLDWDTKSILSNLEWYFHKNRIGKANTEFTLNVEDELQDQAAAEEVDEGEVI